MTDSTMVERLALVFAQHGDHFFGNDGPSNASWDDFSPREQLVATAAARAGIEAMMEGDEATARAAAEAYGDDIDQGEKWAFLVSAFMAGVDWSIARSSLNGEGE